MTRRKTITIGAAAAAALLVPGLLAATLHADAAGAGVPTTTRVSVTSSGAQTEGGLFADGISNDGSRSVFVTAAADVVSGDTNVWPDVYLRDSAAGTTTRVMASGVDGLQPNAPSNQAAISGDGAFIAFGSRASNLVADDTNAASDIFRYEVATGVLTRVSVSDNKGEEAKKRDSTTPSISTDGRFVAFISYANNLVPHDSNGRPDAFVRDTQTGRTVRASIATDGTQGDLQTYEAQISGNGRFVAFVTASALVATDTNKLDDVYLYDRVDKTTSLISRTPTGAAGANPSTGVSISESGRYIAFQSQSPDLVEGDTDNHMDVFVHDRVTGVTTRHGQGNNWALSPSISSTGRYVAFLATSTDLVDGDTNGKMDAFVVDRTTNAVTRVSVANDGTQSDGLTAYAVLISGDGRSVQFSTDATNLVPDDTNDRWDVFVRRFRP